jgi:hypothetical protein
VLRSSNNLLLFQHRQTTDNVVLMEPLTTPGRPSQGRDLSFSALQGRPRHRDPLKIQAGGTRNGTMAPINMFVLKIDCDLAGALES